MLFIKKQFTLNEPSMAFIVSAVSFGAWMSALASGKLSDAIGRKKSSFFALNVKRFVARQPMDRLATLDEIANLALYLACDEYSFTTGATHVIDGGWTN